jgi:hypothetical protein
MGGADAVCNRTTRGEVQVLRGAYPAWSVGAQNDNAVILRERGDRRTCTFSPRSLRAAPERAIFLLVWLLQSLLRAVSAGTEAEVMVGRSSAGEFTSDSAGTGPRA